MLTRPPFIRSNPISHSLPPVKLPSFFLLAFPFSPLRLPSPILFSYFPLPSSPPPFLLIPILLATFPLLPLILLLTASASLHRFSSSSQHSSRRNKNPRSSVRRRGNSAASESPLCEWYANPHFISPIERSPDLNRACPPSSHVGGWEAVGEWAAGVWAVGGGWRMVGVWIGGRASGQCVRGGLLCSGEGILAATLAG